MKLQKNSCEGNLEEPAGNTWSYSGQCQHCGEVQGGGGQGSQPSQPLQAPTQWLPTVTGSRWFRGGWWWCVVWSKFRSLMALSIVGRHHIILHIYHMCKSCCFVKGNMSNVRRVWIKPSPGGRMRMKILTLLTKISPEGNFYLILVPIEEIQMSVFEPSKWIRWTKTKGILYEDKYKIHTGCPKYIGTYLTANISC